MRARTRTDAIRLLRAINVTQAHGEEGARLDPQVRLVRGPGRVGSERYREAMSYLIEEAALLGDEHTAFYDEGDQHAHGYATYCALHAVDLAGLRPGATALVLGAGPIGILCAALLVAAGRRRSWSASPGPLRFGCPDSEQPHECFSGDSKRHKSSLRQKRRNRI
jgi:hypothetical protein